MRIIKGKFDWIFDSLIVVFLIVMIAITLYPFYYIIMASISQPSQLMQHRGLLWHPLGNITVGAYESVFKNPMIGVAYLNTIYYVIVGTFLNLVMTTLGAYPLSRKELKLGRPIMMAFTFTMLFSGGMIPLFLLVRDLNLINSRWALILPPMISVFNMTIMRTNFQALPESLVESAKIDGANDFIVLWNIALPLNSSVIAVMVLFYSVTHWNSWFSAMIYLRNRQLFPLQLILREILIANDTGSMTAGSAAGDAAPLGIAIQYATIIVATVPILSIYPFMQKYFVKGVMVGAIKG